MERDTGRAWWKEPTRGQWAAFGAAWIGWVLDAFDFTIFLLVMPALAREFGVSRTAAAGSITLTLLLRLLGGAAAGAAADRWGRRLPLLVSMVWFAVCDGAVALAPSFAWVLALRTLFGFGMGAEWTAGATLAMESWPPRSRGIASGLLQGSWAVGYLLAAAASGWVVPRFGWRGLFVVAALPALFALPMRLWVPESADWQERAIDKRRVPFSALAERATLLRIVWASLVMALGFGAYYGLTGLYPTLLQDLGVSAGGVARLVSVFNVAMLAGSVACGLLATRLGVARAVAIPALLSLPLLPLYVGAAPSLLWLGAIAAGVLGVGFSGITPLFLTELFPAEVRARAVGIVYHVGAFLAAFVPTLIAALSEHGVALSRAIALVGGTCEILLAVVMLAPSRRMEVRQAGERVPSERTHSAARLPATSRR